MEVKQPVPVVVEPPSLIHEGEVSGNDNVAPPSEFFVKHRLLWGGC